MNFVKYRTEKEILQEKLEKHLINDIEYAKMISELIESLETENDARVINLIGMFNNDLGLFLSTMMQKAHKDANEVYRLGNCLTNRNKELEDAYIVNGEIRNAINLSLDNLTIITEVINNNPNALMNKKEIREDVEKIIKTLDKHKPI